MLYVGFASLTYNVNQIANKYYDEQKIADYWITGQNFNKTDCDKLLKIEGIKEVQPRVTLTVENRYNSDISMQLYAVPKDININIPKILDGKLPVSNDDMMISKLFAEAQGLHIGDRYEVKIPTSGQVLKFNISALVQDPESMYTVNPKTLSADYSKYGFAYIPEGAVASIYGKNIYNEICISTAGSYDVNKLKSSINDVIGTKVINITALKDNASAYYLITTSNSIKAVALVFPMIFFAVGALIMFSTMSRLIENARLSIGTFKALGYHDSQIMLNYLLYSVLVVNFGFILGILPVKMFTLGIFQVIFKGTDLPNFKIIYDTTAIIAAYVITCVVCIGTAYFVTRRELNETPTQCMRPKVQKEAGKNLLEWLPVIWNRLGFTQKYIVRNIFRNKMRAVICIIGVASCMMLIMTALGLMNTINNYLDILDSRAQKYDLLVNLKSDITENQYKHLEILDGVTAVQSEMTTGVRLFTSDRQYATYVKVTDDEISLKLIDPYGPPVERLPPDGVTIDKKIADELEVSVGDTINAKLYGDNSYYEMKVTGILKNINGVYVSRTFWRNTGKGFIPTTLYLKTNDSASVAKQLSVFHFVNNIQDKTSAAKSARDSVVSVVSIVYILIVFGGVLAFVVLYNLGIVSFFEQIRSLATLMVLGFYDKEIKQLVLTENIVFTMIGALIGAPLGLLLTGVISSSIEAMSFQTFVKPISYVLSGILTLVFALIVNLMLGRQMGKIDMLGALKSVE